MFRFNPSASVVLGRDEEMLVDVLRIDLLRSNTIEHIPTLSNARRFAKQVYDWSVELSLRRWMLLVVVRSRRDRERKTSVVLIFFQRSSPRRSNETIRQRSGSKTLIFPKKIRSALPFAGQTTCKVEFFVSGSVTPSSSDCLELSARFFVQRICRTKKKCFRSSEKRASWTCLKAFFTWVKMFIWSSMERFEWRRSSSVHIDRVRCLSLDWRRTSFVDVEQFDE